MSEKWLYLQMTLGMSIMKKHVQPQPMEHRYHTARGRTSPRGAAGVVLMSSLGWFAQLKPLFIVDVPIQTSISRRFSLL